MTTNQAIVQFIYPAEARSDFNMDYYLGTHIPLCLKHFKQQGVRHWNVIVADEGEDYYVEATFYWDSLDDFRAVTFADEIFADVTNFTQTTPTRRVGTILTTGTV